MSQVQQSIRRPNARRWRTALLGALAVLSVVGCAGGQQPVAPCCYVGEVQLARLADVSYQLRGGEQRSFTDVFAEFAPTGGSFGRALPFGSAPIRLVTYDALEEALPRYDANDNNQLERVELVVLYLLELALGTGLEAESVGAGSATGALQLSSADEQGLLRLVDGRLDGLAPAQQSIFRELVKLGNDIRGRNPPFRDSDGSRIWLRG